jgi:hypothetical protein
MRRLLCTFAPLALLWACDGSIAMPVSPVAAQQPPVTVTPQPPPPSPPPPPAAVVLPPQSELVLGDRDYIASVLREIFTPTGHEADLDAVLQAEIRGGIALFGGACNLYSTAGLSDCSQQYKYQLDTGDISARDRQPPSAAREARRMRACERIVDLPSAVHAAVSKIPAAHLEAAPGDAQIAGAYDLFYPGQPLPSSTRDALAVLVEESKASPGESWQLLLLALCQSPGWQLP